MQLPCSLSILAGAADAPFLSEVVRHLDRVQRGRYVTRVLVIDTMPSSQDGAARAQLVSVAQELQSNGLVDEVCELKQDGRERENEDRTHFGRRVRWDRDFRGVPLRGWAVGLTCSAAPYHAHFDCDILLHQARDFCWIDAGIRTLELAPELLTIAPHPGPPKSDGSIEQTGQYKIDERGFYAFDTFSSRRFLTARKTFQRVLPLEAATASRRHRVKSWVGLGSPVLNWELMVQNAMRRAGLRRGHLTDTRAWSLHAPEHGIRFRSLLPAIISAVEHGHYPVAQAGRYDLDLDCWTGFDAAEVNRSA